jgi:hypothetical protein
MAAARIVYLASVLKRDAAEIQSKYNNIISSQINYMIERTLSSSGWPQERKEIFFLTFLTCNIPYLINSSKYF